MSIPSLALDQSESYQVEVARLNYKNSETETNLTKGEFRPQFGFSARLTQYDIDDEEKKDKDIRGGIYFSMPLFTFGRASAKISSARAKENASKMNIDIEKKTDDTKENEIVNIIQSSQNTRKELMDSFADTKLQRKIINDRLDVVSFSTDSACFIKLVRTCFDFSSPNTFKTLGFEALGLFSKNNGRRSSISESVTRRG